MAGFVTGAGRHEHDRVLGGTLGSGSGLFHSPTGVAVAPGGVVYVTDFGNNRVEAFGPLPTPTRNATWGQLKTLYR